MPDTASVNRFEPTVLEHLLGQRRVVARIRVALEAAWNDGTKFPSAALTGPPGLGKSMVARLIAAEMGVELKETLAQTLTCAPDLHALLLDAKDRDVLFIDECDELHPKCQTHLYRAIEDRALFVLSGVGEKRALRIPLADFTLLVATNHEFSLVPPLRERLRLTLRFSHYSVEELRSILCQRTQALGWEADPGVFASIAHIGRGVPRVALRMLEACRRTSRAENSPGITAEHFEKTRQLEGLDSLGLEETEQRYMRILHEAQEPMPLNIIAMRMSLPPRTVSSVIEAYLIRAGLVTKENSLRKLTPKGLRHLRNIEEEE